MDLAWPIWRYPFGSGGNRVTTSVTRPASRSDVMMSRTKSCPDARGDGSTAVILKLPKTRGFPSRWPYTKDVRRSISLGCRQSRVCSAGPTLEGKFGFSDMRDWETAQKIHI